MITAHTMYLRWKALDSNLKYGHELLAEGMKLLENARAKKSELEADLVGVYEEHEALGKSLWAAFEYAMVTGDSTPPNRLPELAQIESRERAINAERRDLDEEIDEILAMNDANLMLVKELKVEASEASNLAFTMWVRELNNANANSVAH